MTAIRSRTVRFHEYGEPLEVLREEETEIPDPDAGSIRIRVDAVGLNPADWEVCRGFRAGSLPRGFGFDVAGTVDAVGEGVTDVAIGDPVFGSADVVGHASGGVADYAILNAWYRIPSGLASVTAATLPMVVTTAVWTLDLMGVGPRMTLLIHGAGGMVGYAAVQIALARGARVIATAGTTFAGDLERFGAQVAPYGDGMADRVRGLADGDVDLVLDTSRPSPGIIPELVGLAGGDPRRVVTISNHEARALGARVNIDELFGGEVELAPAAVFLPEFAALAATGAFRLPIARTYPLGAWRDAVALSVGGAPHGKVVLLPSDETEAG